MPPHTTGTKRRSALRSILFLSLPIFLSVGIYIYVTGGRYVSTDDAYVSANIVAVSTDVSGIVKEVDVTDNEKVAAGQVLFKLDDLPFRLKLAQADGKLATVRDSINALKANYRNIEAEIGQAQDKIAYDQRQFHRQQVLSRQQVVSQAAFDQARVTLQAAQETLAGLRAQLAATVANLAGNPDIPITQDPQYLEALAQREEAARELRHTVVRAPFAGVATNVPSLQPGMYLAASTPAMSIVASGHMWVEAQPKETKLTDIRPDQPAAVTVDTYPGREWHGVVASIGPASQSEFSVLPAENTSGNWVKVVQRIPLRVRIDTGGNGLPPLRAGMSAEVSIDTGHARGWRGAITSLFG